MTLAEDVDDALDPRRSLRDREQAVAELNERHGREAVTASLREATASRREARP